MDVLLHERSDDFERLVCYDSRPHVESEPYVAEVILRVEGAVQHAILRYPDEPSCDQLHADVVEHGIRSSRPYQPGQYCDGSVTPGAVALFVDFCHAKGVDPTGIYRAAYPEREAPTSWTDDVQAAEWQGVAYPEAWTDEAAARMLESLHAVNLHALAEAIEYETGIRRACLFS